MHKHQHVMVDIETLGSSPGSVILSIGAAEFSLPRPAQPVGMETFYANISIDSCLKAGLHVEGRTIEWWFQQPKEAQIAFRDPKPRPLRDVLTDFRKWLGEEGVEGRFLWSHGSNFDTVLLDAAYRLFWERAPSNYKNIRDTRTLFANPAVFGVSPAESLARPLPLQASVVRPIRLFTTT